MPTRPTPGTGPSVVEEHVADMPSSSTSAVIIVDGDRVQVVADDAGVARALVGALPPDLGSAWPGAAAGGRGTVGAGPPDALALGGVARQPQPRPQQAHHPRTSGGPPGALRADGGVAFVLYLAIGFASTLACIAALVGVFYVARAVAARNAADAARAAEEAGEGEEEVRPPGPPPKPTVVVVHPGGELLGVGVEEGWADDGVAAAPAAKSPPASPGKGAGAVGLPPKGSSPAALAVAALPDCRRAAGGENGGGGFIRAHRPQSPAAAAVAAVTAAAAAATAAAGAGGPAEPATAPQPPPAATASLGWTRRLLSLLTTRAQAPPPPAVGEP